MTSARVLSARSREPTGARYVELVIGPLSDALGRRRPLIVGLNPLLLRWFRVPTVLGVAVVGTLGSSTSAPMGAVMVAVTLLAGVLMFGVVQRGPQPA